MSEFSEKCKLYIKQTNVTLYQIAKQSQLDRTTIQRMVSGFNSYQPYYFYSKLAMSEYWLEIFPFYLITADRMLQLSADLKYGAPVTSWETLSLPTNITIELMDNRCMNMLYAAPDGETTLFSFEEKEICAAFSDYLSSL